jgi:hypothetical protein
VPAKDRLRLDEERRPAFAWQEIRENGDERPVRPREAGSGDLTAQHKKLVAEDQDLRVLGDGVHPMDAGQPHDAADQSVEEAERHGRLPSPSEFCLVKLTIEFVDPSRSLARIPAACWREERLSRRPPAGEEPDQARFARRTRRGPTTPTLRSRGRRARLGSAGSPTAGSLSMPIRTVRSAAGVRRCRGARSGSPDPSMLTSCPVTDAWLRAAPPAYALSPACPGAQGCGQWGLASTPGLQRWVDAPPSRVRPAPPAAGSREVISGKGVAQLTGAASCWRLRQGH